LEKGSRPDPSRRSGGRHVSRQFFLPPSDRSGSGIGVNEDESSYSSSKPALPEGQKRDCDNMMTFPNNGGIISGLGAQNSKAQKSTSG